MAHELEFFFISLINIWGRSMYKIYESIDDHVFKITVIPIKIELPLFEILFCFWEVFVLQNKIFVAFFYC